MLPDNAFLRRLPITLDRTQALRLEALVFSADVIQASFATIRTVTAYHREKITSVHRDIRTALFTHAWAIVDGLHVVLQVLRVGNFRSQHAVDFIKKYDAARVLRNKMDHLTANARNVASTKNRPPVFGSLGYICVPDSLLDVIDGKAVPRGGGTVMIASGRFSGDERLEAVNPSGRKIAVPVGGFRLQAFDRFLELENAEADLRNLITELNLKLEAEYMEFAKRTSVEKGIPIEKIMSNPVADVTVYLAFQIGPEGTLTFLSS